MTFIQLNARPNFFLSGYFLILSIKDGPVKCAKVCDKSVVILKIKRAAAEEINIYSYSVMDHLEICKSRRMGWFQRLSVWYKGAFLNYVDKILPIIDHLPAPVDINALFSSKLPSCV